MGFISIHPLVKVWPTREEVSNGIVLTRNMSKSAIEVLEIFNPVGLSTRDLLRLVEVLKVFVISVNLNRFGSTKKEWLSHFEAKEDSSKFFIMGIIVAFSGEEALTIETNRVDAIFKSLGNDGAQRITRGISFKDKFSRPIRRAKDW